MQIPHEQKWSIDIGQRLWFLASFWVCLPIFSPISVLVAEALYRKTVTSMLNLIPYQNVEVNDRVRGKNVEYLLACSLAVTSPTKIYRLRRPHTSWTYFNIHIIFSIFFLFSKFNSDNKIHISIRHWPHFSFQFRNNERRTYRNYWTIIMKSWLWIMKICVGHGICQPIHYTISEYRIFHSFIFCVSPLSWLVATRKWLSCAN